MGKIRQLQQIMQRCPQSIMLDFETAQNDNAKRGTYVPAKLSAFLLFFGFLRAIKTMAAIEAIPMAAVA